MAMTNAQKAEMYRFFIVAFDAAPGVVYMNQLDEALSAGMTTKQIVNVFTQKSVFTDAYPSFLSNEQFATLLVNNVVKASATEAAKAQAVSDISAALQYGLSKGDVIYNVFTNIASKSVTDVTWGNLVKQMNNQVAAADYYTAVLLRASTDVNELKSVIANISPTQAGTSQAALTYSGTSFAESTRNDGSISTTLTISVIGDKFKGAIGTTVGTVENVPTGLNAQLTKLTDTSAQLSLTGSATAHSDADSINSLKVSFGYLDFLSGLNPSNGTMPNLEISFRDLWPSVASNTLSISHLPTNNLVINLLTDSVTHGGVSVESSTGNYADAVNADLSGMPVPEAGATVGTVTFLGSTAANTYLASPLGDHITPGGGNDTLTLGAGSDTIVFPSEDVTGVLTIKQFTPGEDGDVLDFSNFLVVTGTDNIDYVDTNASAATLIDWANGDVLMALTEADIDESGVAALFGTYYEEPTTGAKLIVMTADVTGDTKIWAITNLSGAGAASIDDDEVRLIGILENINNFEMAGFSPPNFI
jgi:hypothetical protein